jgi:hypothetical protein
MYNVVVVHFLCLTPISQKGQADAGPQEPPATKLSTPERKLELWISRSQFYLTVEACRRFSQRSLSPPSH